MLVYTGIAIYSLPWLSDNFLKRESTIREKLVREQNGRLHANPIGLGGICFKWERYEATEPVRFTRESCNEERSRSFVNKPQNCVVIVSCAFKTTLQRKDTQESDHQHVLITVLSTLLSSFQTTESLIIAQLSLIWLRSCLTSRNDTALAITKPAGDKALLSLWSITAYAWSCSIYLQTYLISDQIKSYQIKSDQIKSNQIMSFDDVLAGTSSCFYTFQTWVFRSWFHKLETSLTQG